MRVITVATALAVATGGTLALMAVLGQGPEPQRVVQSSPSVQPATSSGPKAALKSTPKAGPPSATTPGTAPTTEMPAVGATKSTVPAKTIFGAFGTPAPLAARAIGFYSKGCLAGAKPLAIDGPVWQAMRLSRNRNWGHPDLIRLIERLANDAKAHDGWPGLLVGDISQPRGGPMLTGHASHQIGLDADIWLTPMPDRRLSAKEREEISAISMLATDGVYADPKVWTVQHAKLILRAASYPQVERILVHPGIKLALCQQPGADPKALAKIRPYWGHEHHMHVRISCPKGSEGCQAQVAIVNPVDTGCGQEVDDWIRRLKQPPLPPDPKPAPPKPQLTLDQLPAECRLVVNAGSPMLTKPAATSIAKGASGK